MALAAVLSPSRVAKQLRVKVAYLHQRIAAQHAPATPAPAPGFVEVPRSPAALPSHDDLTVEFQQLDSGASETVSFRGPWALFRLLDASRQMKGDAVSVTVVSRKGRSAEILIKPSRQRHPFGRNTLAGFSC